MKASENLCPGCFEDTGQAAVCPHCGYQETNQRSPIILPPRTVLHHQYLVGRVLGEPGGFGITYLAWDTYLETRTAIKEYLPRDLAGRDTDHTSVVPHTGRDAETFQYGLEQFIQEARTLAQFDHPNIVRVRTFFEANSTAYLVMDYYEGLSLDAYLHQHGGKLPEAQAVAIVMPVLDGLREVHQEGFLHRDIKPQNIYLARLRRGGTRPVLLDFGAARVATAERSQSMSAVLTPGYAPYEQYHRRGRQGPWTDVYGCAATLYRMVTGVKPQEAAERMFEDDLRPAVEAEPSVSERLSAALVSGLSLRPEGRPQTVEAFQSLLMPEAPHSSVDAEPPVVGVVAPPVPAPVPQPRVVPPPVSAPLSPLRKPAPPRSSPAQPIETVPLEQWTNSVGMTFVKIPSGRFLMGSEDGESDELPVHSVEITRGFWLQTTPVTQAQWERVMAKKAQRTTWLGKEKYYGNPSRFKGADRPVERVSWKDAQVMIQSLNAREGDSLYRLPSEAEWEYACRAGSIGWYCFGNEQRLLDEYAWYGGNSEGQTHPVGMKRPNEWGLYDMHGNVWEWVEDRYAKKYYGTSRGTDPQGPASGTYRVLRGGSWTYKPVSVRSALRGSSGPSLRLINTGFRFLRTR